MEPDPGQAMKRRLQAMIEKYPITAKPWTKEWRRQYFLAVWYGIAHKEEERKPWLCRFHIHQRKPLLAPVILYVKFEDEAEPWRKVKYREVGRFCIRCHLRTYDEPPTVRKPPAWPDGHSAKSILGDTHRRDLDR